jgi:hypothetical protein
VDKYGDDEKSFIVYTTTLYSIGLYWIFGGIFFVIQFCPFLKKFRHQEEKELNVTKMVKVSFKFNC